MLQLFSDGVSRFPIGSLVQTLRSRWVLSEQNRTQTGNEQFSNQKQHVILCDDEKKSARPEQARRRGKSHHRDCYRVETKHTRQKSIHGAVKRVGRYRERVNRLTKIHFVFTTQNSLHFSNNEFYKNPFFF